MEGIRKFFTIPRIILFSVLAVLLVFMIALISSPTFADEVRAIPVRFQKFITNDTTLSPEHENFVRSYGPYRWHQQLSEDDVIAGGDLKPGQIAIISYLEVNCEHCANHFLGVFPRILEKTLEKSDDVIYVYRHRERNSQDIFANISKCVQKNSEANKYYEYMGYYFMYFYQNNYQPVGEHILYDAVEALGLNRETIETCSEDRKFASELEEQFKEVQYVLGGTPSFIIGVVNEDLDVDGFTLLGNWEPKVFETYIQVFRDSPDAVMQIWPNLKEIRESGW